MNRRTDTKLYLLLFLCVAALIALITVVSCISCGSEVEQPPVTQTEDNGIQTVRVTFAEGKNVLQMGEILEENGVCSSSDFYDTMNSTDYSADFGFLPSFESLSDRPYKLEGYLFPDTYDFYLPESADSVIRRFLKNFSARVTPEMMAQSAAAGEYYGQTLSFDDVLTMASIVEREIHIPDEMDGVAAVFYNRMKYPGGTVDGSATGGFFQSDATKFYPYVFGTAPDGFVSDYNTFNVKGLPKGPICCPSLDAIKASLSPDHGVDAFFFYTDANKKVYYAVTYSEHQANYQYCKDNGLVPTF